MTKRLCLVLPALLLAAAPPAAHAAFPRRRRTTRSSTPARCPNATNEQWDLASPAGGFDRGISVDRAWPLTTGAGAVIARHRRRRPARPPRPRRPLVRQPARRARTRRRDRSSNGVDDDRNGFVDDWRGYDFYARRRRSDLATPATRTGRTSPGVLGARSRQRHRHRRHRARRAHPAAADRRQHPPPGPRGSPRRSSTRPTAAPTS